MPGTRHGSTYASTVTARPYALHVDDDGDPSPARPCPGPGFGLTGMVERAALLGGTCRAGPRPGRGWAVDATLPREVPA